jgi:hypothetical protein
MRDTITITKSEFDRLQSIESAAKRFDQCGSTANQMSPEQWEAYIDLKALFHGGSRFGSSLHDSQQEFRKRVVDAVIADLRAWGPIREALLGICQDEQKENA